MTPTAPSIRTPGAALSDPTKQAMLLAALYIAQEQQGYLTKETIERVAKRLNLPVGEVYSTASFYTLFRTEPAMRVNDQLYENLTPAGIDAILERLMGEV